MIVRTLAEKTQRSRWWIFITRESDLTLAPFPRRLRPASDSLMLFALRTQKQTVSQLGRLGFFP